MPFEHDETLEAFVAEASEAVADLKTDILAIEAGGADLDTELVAKVVRTIHSMKGTAGRCGLEPLGALAHEMENLLDLVRDTEISPPPGVFDVLLRGADRLAHMLADVLDSNEFSTSELEQELEAIEELGPPEDRDPSTAIAMPVPSSAAGESGADHGQDGADDGNGRESAALFDLEDEDGEVDLPAADGSVAFLLMPTGPMNEHRREGRAIHMLEIDLLEQDAAQDRRPCDVLRSIDEHGTIIQSYVRLGPIPPLETGDADELILLVLYATDVSTEMLPAVLMIPAAGCTLIADGAHAGEPEEDAGISFQEPAFDAIPAPAPAPLPEPVEDPHIPAPEAPAARATVPEAETPHAQPDLRLIARTLDTLMNLAGELVHSRNQLIHAASADPDDDAGGRFRSVAARIHRITSELQDAITRTRIQPVGAVFDTFPRIVRDLATQRGKEIALDIRGSEVELDTSIIETIGEPLTHLIRSSCEHGVETPEKRLAVGKPARGTIIVEASQQAGRVFITIEDDGDGIDPQMFRASTVDEGVMSADEAAELSDLEAQSLIFEAGLSCTEKITEDSGRAAGMDVVRTTIESLGGVIELDSTPGRGSRFMIQLPITPSIMPSLVIFSDGHRYAIPQTNIRELIRVKPADVPNRIGRIDETEVLRLREDLLPLIDLVDVMHDGRTIDECIDARNADRREQPRQDVAAVEGVLPSVRAGTRRALNIIVIEAGTLRYGLVVDAVADLQEIVVKRLGRHMRTCRTLAGATVLGDGQIALVLDVTGVAVQGRLHRKARRAPSEHRDGSEAGGQSGGEGEKQSSLLFTNHDDEMFAVPTALISRIERVEAGEIESLGGRDTLQCGGEALPLMSLEHHLDVLPRPEQDHYNIVVLSFDGSDLGLIAPRIVDIRVISSEVDRDTSVENGVIGSVVEQDRVIRVLDVASLGRTAFPDRFHDPSPLAACDGAKVILLAEPSRFIRRQLTTFLESGGYEVVGCEDGRVAWQILQDPSRRFDMVLTDIEMPNMNGHELTRTIRADPMFAHLPIIALSSLSTEEDIERARDAGVNAYQLKMDLEALLKDVRGQLESAAQRSGSDSAAAATGVPA